MKNGAGYGISRLMAGSLGTLAVLLEISLKGLPKPACETTVTFKMGAQEALKSMNAWAGQPVPLSGACYADDTLYIRLSGSAGAVEAAQSRLSFHLRVLREAGLVTARRDGRWADQRG